MKAIKSLLILLLITHSVKAGEPISWLTYGHSKYVGSPGIEACYLFRPRIGVNLGVSFFFQNPDHSRLTNITHDAGFGFYNANAGLAGYVFNSGNHFVGLIAGFKLYYGPDYRKLRFYEEGGYYLYFDASFLHPDYGLDIGLFYAYRKFTLLGKFDLARNRFRLGIGYRLNLKKKNDI